MWKQIMVACIVLLSWTTAYAQTTGTEADHEALRKLKAETVAAINARDYEAAERLLHKPFMATVITQDSFTNFDKLKAYFESLFTRPLLRMKSMKLSAEADEISQIYQGPIALTRGSTKEFYELTDGRSFDINGRWTAVSIKENGEWRIAAVHTGTNFLDNPVINAIEHSVMSAMAWSVAGGLIGGVFIGWFLRGYGFG